MRCLICGADHASCKGSPNTEPMSIVDLPRRAKMGNGDFVADKDYFADKDGNLVEANDPAKLTKIVGEGGTLSAEEAAKYGLSNEAPESEEAEEETVTRAPSKSASKASKKGK